MRRIIVVALSAALLTTAWMFHAAAVGSTRTAGATKPAAASTGAPTNERARSVGFEGPTPPGRSTPAVTWRPSSPGPAWPPASTPPTCAPPRPTATRSSPG